MRTSAFVTAAFLTTLYCVSGGPPCPSSCIFDIQLQKCKCAPKKLLLDSEKELLLKNGRKWKTQLTEGSDGRGRIASTTTASINVSTPSAVTLSANMEAVDSLCGGDNCDRWRTPHGGVGCRCPMRTRENPPIDLEAFCRACGSMNFCECRALVSDTSKRLQCACEPEV